MGAAAIAARARRPRGRAGRGWVARAGRQAIVCVLAVACCWAGPSVSAAIPVQGGGANTLGEALLRLRSPRSGEREAARRWLIEHLRPEDGPALLNLAGSSSLEGRTALAEVLSSHPRLFAHAVALAGHSEPAIAAVGLQALEQSVLRWNPGCAEPPLPPGQIPAAWRRGGEVRQSLTLSANAQDLVWDLDRWQHFGDGRVPLVLAPESFPIRAIPAPRGGGGAAVLRGTWLEGLVPLAQAYRHQVTVWAWRPPTDPYDATTPDLEGAWVLIERPPRRDSGTESQQDGTTGAQRLARWMVQAAQAEDRSLARAAAQSLAQVGWPDALAWLDQRCAQGRTEYWPALCGAAARGHLVHSFHTQAGLQRWLAEGLPHWTQDTAPSAAQRWSWHLARRALQALPDRIEAKVALSEPLLAVWRSASDQAGAQERFVWLILSTFAERRSDDARIAALAWEVLAARDSSHALRRLALATVAHAVGREQVPAATRTVNIAWLGELEPAARRRAWEQADRARLLPAEGADWRPPSAEDAARMALWAWSLRTEWPQAERVAVVWLEAHARAGSWRAARRGLAPALLAGRQGEIEALLLHWQSQSSSGAPEALRYRLALGGLRPSERETWLSERLAKESRNAQDWLDIALCAGDPDLGARARGALLGALGQDVPAGVLEPALIEAVGQVRTTRDEFLVEAWSGDMRRAALRSDHPLASRMLDEGWGEENPPGDSVAQELGSEEVPFPW